MPKAKRKIEVPVSRSKFFDVITDYKSYPTFLSSLTDAKVVEQTKNKSTVEFKAKAVGSFEYTLELTEKNPTSLSWKLVDGDYMRKNSGKWTLKDVKKGQATEAIYEIEVELSRLVPSFAVKALLNESLPTTLEEFKNRAIKVAKKKPKKKRA